MKGRRVEDVRQGALFLGDAPPAAEVLSKLCTDISALAGDLALVVESRRGLTRARMLWWQKCAKTFQDGIQGMLDRAK